MVMEVDGRRHESTLEEDNGSINIIYLMVEFQRKIPF